MSKRYHAVYPPESEQSMRVSISSAASMIAAEHSLHNLLDPITPEEVETIETSASRISIERLLNPKGTFFYNSVT